MKKVKNFKDLIGLESETHYIEHELFDDTCWVMSKDKSCKLCGKAGYYLTTHTFYKNQIGSTRKLFEKFGFDVEVVCEE